MTTEEQALERLAQWWAGLTTYNGLPAQGTLGGALIVLERLQSHFVLDIREHTTNSGTQISGQSGASAAKILKRYGEERKFLSEGGRTSRGAPPSVGELLGLLEPLQLNVLTLDKRNGILREMQRWLVDKVGEYFSRARVKFTFAAEHTAWQVVANILSEARAVGKEGPVAQYLVGAKLALRFPDVDVRNDSYSTSDVQSGLPGDFVVGGTAFHVTVSPMPHLYQKASANVQDGYRAYILVPERWVVGARQNAELVAPGRISVQSIESFVSQNLDELATFAPDAPATGFRRLLDVYNARVDAAETDKSLLIEIPHNLLG